MATCKAGSLAAFVGCEKLRRYWRGGIATGRGERREFSHFWPGVRSGRPELTRGPGGRPPGASWKAWREARTARGETEIVCAVSAASFAKAPG
jgi:hypothetical protein